MTKKSIAVLLCIMMLFSVIPAPAFADVITKSIPEVNAAGYIVADAETGTVLFGKNADVQAAPADLVKVMTAVLAIESGKLDTEITVKNLPDLSGVNATTIHLVKGERYAMRSLVEVMLVSSANDAAYVVAEGVSGSVDKFVTLMNNKAKDLGMTNTVFKNPHGQDAEGQLSTASDLAKLAAYAMQNPIFVKTVSTKTVNIGQRNLRNHNKLLWRLEGADGVKTGFTKAAGRILVSSCKRQGRRLIAVTMNDRNDWNDHQQLIENGFADYSVRQIVVKGDCLGTIPVISGEQGEVQLLAMTDFSYSLTADEEPQIVLTQPGFIYAPVVQGQDAGYAYVCLNGKAVGKVPLVYGQSVETEEIEKPSLWERLFGRR